MTQIVGSRAWFQARIDPASNDTTCAIANCYDGSPTNFYCTIFDRYGYPEKAYYAFIMFRALYELGTRVAVEKQEDGLYVLAAADKSTICLLITAFNGGGEYKISIAGLDSSACYRLQKYLTDESHCYDLVEDTQGSLSQLCFQHQFGK